MSATVRVPSHSARISAALSFSSTAPSGYCSTFRCRASSYCTRAYFQSLGRDASDNVIASRFAVCVVDRIDHHPQHLDLERERFERALLCLDGGAVRRDDLESVVAVARRLREAAVEVLVRVRANPRIVLWQRVETPPHDVRREQLRERRCRRLDPRSGFAEGDVHLRREAHAGEYVSLILHLLARNAERDAELDPLLDAALAIARAVVVDDALDPLSSHRGHGAVRDDRTVLTRDCPLIREPIRNPPLHLPLRELALVHQLMERVLHVIRSMKAAQRRNERVWCERT